METALEYFWLCLAALLAGGINTLAGGGTLLTFPMLITVLAQHGSHAAVLANGTSTVALVPASIGGAWGFRREMHAARKWLLILIGPSLVGGVVGSRLVTTLDPKYFNALVPWLIFGAASLFTLQPLLARWRKQAVEHAEGPPKASTVAGVVIFQFFVAVYGGYFGAGIGILMLSALGLMGIKDIHQMNALKTVLATAINGVAVANFVWEGVVVWPYALAMMVTSVIGGYLAACIGRSLPQKVVRYFVISVGFFLAAYFFWKQYGGR
jgi:uncharacterized membrane protein YfcA